MNNNEIVNNDISEYRQLVRLLNETAHDLFTNTDDEAGIHKMLQRLLNYFDAEKVYVYEHNYELNVTVNTYEVCAKGLGSEKKPLYNELLKLRT